jgi:hypothetical protein
MSKASNGIKTGAVLIALFVFSISSVQAIPRNYVIGSGSSVSANTDSGLIIETQLSPTLSGTAFSLNNGDSYSFNFFNISTPESSVNFDDVFPQPIVATLDFDIPDLDAVISGVTFTGLVGWTKTAGEVVWSGGSETISVADRTFIVSLNNAVFDAARIGSYGNAPATIVATVKQLSSSATSVPDGGATLSLLGLAFVGLAALKRKYRS